jgi:hypothetical protein
MSSLWVAVFIQVLDRTGPLMLNLNGTPYTFQKVPRIHFPTLGCSIFIIVRLSAPITDTELACCAIHVVKATNGQGNNQTVEKLEEIAEILDSKGFHIIGYAFDRDFCFNKLHSQFQQYWHLETFEKTLTIMIFKKHGPTLGYISPTSYFEMHSPSLFIRPFSNRGK